MTLFSKAKAYEAGEKVSFGGKDYSPLYTPKNDTLINLFRITADEQKQLKTIVSQAEAAERHRKREEDRRRAAGKRTLRPPTPSRRRHRPSAVKD